MRTTRLEAFSDGVLAIIITIMVLELKVPTGHTFADLRHTTGTSLLTYLLSFVYVGIYWSNHHQLFHLVRRTTGAILWANLALLFCLSLFPFTTAWMDDTDFARTPVITYGLNLMAAAIVYYVLVRVILYAEGGDSPLRRAVGRDFKGKISVVVYLAGIVSALLTGHGRLGIWIGYGFYILTAVMWIVPDRRIDRIVREQGVPD